MLTKELIDKLNKIQDKNKRIALSLSEENLSKIENMSEEDVFDIDDVIDLTGEDVGEDIVIITVK